MSEMNRIIGQNIMRLRDRLGLTQAELARRLGVARPTVTQLESGVKGPSKKMLPRIAEELGVTVDELYRSPDQSTSPSAEDGVLRFHDPAFDRMWREASPEVRRDIEEYLRFKLEQQRKRQQEKQQDA